MPPPAGAAKARRARMPAPYSPAERAELAAIARAQRGPAMRASALAMVVFGTGAGLRPGELAGLRGCHVTRRGGQAVAEVSAGRRPARCPSRRGTRAGRWISPARRAPGSRSGPARPAGPARTSPASSPSALPVTRRRLRCRRAGAGPASSATTWRRALRCRRCWRSPGSPRRSRWPATPTSPRGRPDRSWLAIVVVFAAGQPGIHRTTEGVSNAVRG